MRALVVEDEKLASDRLIELIHRYDPKIEIAAVSDSVKGSVKFLKSEQVDLAFMDIQLADGISFEIFDKTSVDIPIVFTTAFDKYAIQAFKVNSVDYLLKPIDFEDLCQSMDKYRTLQGRSSIIDHQSVERAIKMLSVQYKERFVVKIGEHIKSISVDEILFFFSRDKATYCRSMQGRSYLLDQTLEEISDMVDPLVFHRVNRSYIIHFKSILDIIAYSNSRLRLVLAQWEENEIIVSRDRVSTFKSWLDR